MQNFQKMWKKIGPTLIIGFLAWHFSAVLTWVSPDSEFKQKIITPFISYLNYFGLWQGWAVFEHPRTYNEYMTAQIIYNDGTEKTWEFPRMEKLDWVQKLFKEKYRRWGNDCVADEDTSFLWPDAARYIARTNNVAGNPPVSVSLIRHWIWIDPPETGLNQPLRTADDGADTLYTCAILPQELK
jgi:hypothetical protein